MTSGARAEGAAAPLARLAGAALSALAFRLRVRALLTPRVPASLVPAPTFPVQLLLAPMVLASALLISDPAAAQDRACVTRVNHLDIAIAPGAILADPDVSLRERLLGWPSGLWNRTWGRPVNCDSATTIAYLAGVLAIDEVDGYCLAEAPGDEGWLLVPGDRNFRGRCRVTICDRINNTAEDGAAVARAVTSVVTGREINDLGDGVAAVASTSGAMMLTGQSSTLSGLLGQGATAVGAALSTPAAAGAAAVTVIAVGGAVYLCRD